MLTDEQVAEILYESLRVYSRQLVRSDRCLWDYAPERIKNDLIRTVNQIKNGATPAHIAKLQREPEDIDDEAKKMYIMVVAIVKSLTEKSVW